MAFSELMTLAQKAKAYEDAIIYTNYTCNLSCPRCFLRGCSESQKHYELTLQEYKNFLLGCQRQNLKLNVIHFTGGEPTLWPYLRTAIAMTKKMQIARTIRVVSNGFNRNARDYGLADVVHVTHYGALNRLDILRLKRQLGRRLRVQWTVHLPWPYPEPPDQSALPASCGCICMALVGDRIYPCGFAAGQSQGQTLSVDENFYARLCNGEPQMQELCKRCLSNRKIKTRYMAGTTFEAGFWDSPVGLIASIRARLWGLRALYGLIYRKRLAK